jgi:amino acid transporter
LSRLHPRFKTPTGSIIAVGATTFILTVLVNSGVGAQEGFQILLNGAIIFWALTNMVMFAIPLFAPGEKPSLGVRFAALSAMGMTMLYIVLSIFPIIHPESCRPHSWNQWSWCMVLSSRQPPSPPCHGSGVNRHCLTAFTRFSSKTH